MNKNRSGGFTLIELMIVVVVIAILASVAFPAYKQYVQKTRRSDATTALTNAAALQERFFTANNSYSNDITEIGGALSEQEYYDIAIATMPTSAPCTVGTSPNQKFYCYTLTATYRASGPQSQDTACKVFTIKHTGETAATDSSAAANDEVCWSK